MGEIITDNLEQEFQAAKRISQAKRALNNLHGGGYMLRSALLEDKNGIPKRVRQKMASPAIGNIRMGSPNFYHPIFQSMNIMLPRDRRERNEWCRHFYRTEPLVATALDLHTEFPISDFSNVVSDPSIKKFFDYMAFDKLDIINLLLDIGLEYWKIGDVFPFGQLNENEGMWDRFVILNPDFIDIKTSVLAGEPIIELIPDETIKNIIDAGPRGAYADIYKQFPDDVIRQVRMGGNIKLDNRLVSHIAHKASQYETWGTPIMMRCFKALIYKDRLRDAQLAIANRHITPLRIFKVGTPGEPYPSQEDLDNLRDTLLMASDDPDFVLVYHYALSTDYVGSTGKILPLNTEFDFITKEIMNGLGINEAMVNGTGPTYANAQVGMDTLARRYMSYRLKLESWIRNKVYKPIAAVQGFYKPSNGIIARKYLSEGEQRRLATKREMELIIPEISWQQKDLTSNQTIMSFIQQLQSKGLISMTTILPMLGLDPETEMKHLEKERGTVFDPNATKTGPLPGNNPLGVINPSPSVSKVPPLNHANPGQFGFPGPIKPGPNEGQSEHEQAKIPPSDKGNDEKGHEQEHAPSSTGDHGEEDHDQKRTKTTGLGLMDFLERTGRGTEAPTRPSSQSSKIIKVRRGKTVMNETTDDTM